MCHIWGPFMARKISKHLRRPKRAKSQNKPPPWMTCWATKLDEGLKSQQCAVNLTQSQKQKQGGFCSSIVMNSGLNIATVIHPCILKVSCSLKHERSGKQISHTGEPGSWHMPGLETHVYTVFVFCRLSASSLPPT